MPTLTSPKRERFAQELAKGKPAYIAHKTAGLSGDRGHASRLQRDSSIVQRIAEIMAAKEKIEVKALEIAAERLSIDREWILARLVENVDRAMQATEVMLGGKPSGEYKYDGAVANKSLELLGKEFGMFKDRLALEGGVVVEVVNF